MTLEDLSAATAQRYENRMMHDVKHTTRLQGPPRPDPPAFGRNAMEDQEAASARVGRAVDIEEVRRATETRVTGVEDDVRVFFETFQRIELHLHKYLTDMDRRRIRNAIAPPDAGLLGDASTLDPMVVALAVCAMVVLGGVYSCNARPPMRYRSSADTLSVQGWNINRLLRPFNRSR